ncbi:MAG: 2Fe-2S iron-sulfur cluster binding domain-containing protein, partial [Anaerolinea sp.]|nr:2Fe-2S iron-sulfur cluster binding domain-containing protein [Anaerolinea sp.]
MANHTVTFNMTETAVTLPTGSLLTEAARLAGVALNQPCGGQGRCGRCAVQVTGGDVRRRSALRLSAADVARGYALACQTVIEGDVSIHVPPQEQLERRLTTDRTAAEVAIPAGYDPQTAQTIRRVTLTLTPPNMDDQTDDWSRLQRALRQQAGIENAQISLPLLRKLGQTLRQGNWQVTAIFSAECGAQSAESAHSSLVTRHSSLVTRHSSLVTRHS